VIETIRQGLRDDGFAVSISKLCRWFEVPRRTVYYRPSRKQPALQGRFLQPIKQMIEEKSVLWIPNRRTPTEVQQEHGTAHFPAETLAGKKAAGGISTASTGNALRRRYTE